MTQFLTIAGHAQPAAVSFEDTTSNVGNVNNLTRGYTFHVNQPFKITALGIFDSDQDGLFDNHIVTLWNLAGIQVASVTVPAGTSAELINGFRYVPITPVTLTLGLTYTVGAYYPNSSTPAGDHMITSATSLVIDPDITILHYRFAHPGYFDPEPDLVDSQSFGANFLVAEVPEPSTVALIGLGSLVGLMARRRSCQMKHQPQMNADEELNRS
jgi:hypothetical protein